MELGGEWGMGGPLLAVPSAFLVLNPVLVAQARLSPSRASLAQSPATSHNAVSDQLGCSVAPRLDWINRVQPRTIQADITADGLPSMSNRRPLVEGRCGS